MASAGRRNSHSKEKQKVAAAERRASVDAQQSQLATVISATESENSPTTSLVSATKQVVSARTFAKILDPYGRIVRPGIVDCEAIMEYYMHGRPRLDGEEDHFTLGGSDRFTEAVERVMYAIFDDRFFLHDAFKSLLGSDSTQVLSEDQMAHWVSCLSTCSPVEQAKTAPAPRCQFCISKGFVAYRCKCVPRALPQSEKNPDVGRAAEWKELGPLGTDKKERVGWASEDVASTTLQEQMKNIIEDCLQKRAPVAPELAGDAPPVFFDWHDFLVVTMDFYVALGIKSMHAIFSVLLGNECDETAPALEPKTESEPSADDDGGATRPAAKAAFEDDAGEQQQIGTESGGGLFACCRPRKAEPAAAVTVTPASGAASS
jgi:hypothetical protein